MTAARPKLTFTVGGKSVSLDDTLVTNVGYAGALTPLPCTGGAIEGLADIDGRPVVQVDLARALGGPMGTGGKRAVVRMPAGEIALRCENIAGGGGGEPLDLSTLLPWAAAPAGAGAGPAPGMETGHDTGHDTGHRPEPGVPLLVVEAGGERIGLLVRGGERMEAVRDIRDCGAGRLVVALDGRLLVGRRLGSVPGPGDPAAGWAVVVPRHDGSAFALVVDRVVELKEINPADLLVPDPAEGALTAWHAEAEGIMRVVPITMDCDGGHDPMAAGALAPAASAPPNPESPAAIRPGVRADCAGISVMLPYETVIRALDELPGRLDRRPRGTERAASPVLDAAKLLGQRSDRQRHECWLAVSNGDGAFVLAIDVLRLEPDCAGPDWRPLPAMPLAPTVLFDALRRDDAGAWVFRARPPSRLRTLPWSVRRAIAGAMTGWVQEADF